MTSGCDERDWIDQVVIEPMTPGHLAAVLAIERASFPSAWTADSYLRELRNPNGRYFVAQVGGQVAGYAGMWVVADEAHISTIAVHPDQRRRGLGTRLLAHLVAVAEDLQARQIILEVRWSNLAAQALYVKLGFRPIALRPRYYADTGEDGVVMRKTLSAGLEPD